MTDLTGRIIDICDDYDVCDTGFRDTLTEQVSVSTNRLCEAEAAKFLRWFKGADVTGIDHPIAEVARTHREAEDRAHRYYTLYTDQCAAFADLLAEHGVQVEDFAAQTEGGDTFRAAKHLILDLARVREALNPDTTQRISDDALAAYGDNLRDALAELSEVDELLEVWGIPQGDEQGALSRCARIRLLTRRYKEHVAARQELRKAAEAAQGEQAHERGLRKAAEARAAQLKASNQRLLQQHNQSEETILRLQAESDRARGEAHRHHQTLQRFLDGAQAARLPVEDVIILPAFLFRGGVLELHLQQPRPSPARQATPDPSRLDALAEAVLEQRCRIESLTANLTQARQVADEALDLHQPCGHHPEGWAMPCMTIRAQGQSFSPDGCGGEGCPFQQAPSAQAALSPDP